MGRRRIKEIEKKRLIARFTENISLWDIFRITELAILGEMYEEFFPANKLTMDQRLPTSPPELFRICAHLFTGNSRPKSTEWVKEFIPKQLDVMPRKNLGSSLQDFKE